MVIKVNLVHKYQFKIYESKNLYLVAWFQSFSYVFFTTFPHFLKLLFLNYQKFIHMDFPQLVDI